MRVQAHSLDGPGSKAAAARSVSPPQLEFRQAGRPAIQPTTGESFAEHPGAPAPLPPCAPRAAATRGIVIGRYRGTVVVTVRGDLDLARAAYLGPVLTDLIDGQGNLSLIVDLHDATATDAEHLLVFRDAAEQARRRGGAMTISEPPPALHDALRQWGLHHLVRDLAL